MRLLSGIIVSAVLLFLSFPAGATVYQYFDEEGTLVVTDNPYKIKKPKYKQPNIKYRNNKLNFKEDVMYDYYPVSGNNILEVLSDTTQNGPFDAKENKNYPAQTRWTTGWSYAFDSRYRIEGSSLYVSLYIHDIEFNSFITVLLPTLSENTTLDNRDLVLWNDFLRGLLDHENDHVMLVNDPQYRDDAAKKISSIKELILPYDPRSNIDSVIKSAVEEETAKIGHDLIKKIKARNDEYDRITEHGLKPQMRDSFFR